MKTTYRDFEIEYDTLVGQFLYIHKDCNDNNINATSSSLYGMCDTEQQCKDEIDKHYANAPIVYRDFIIRPNTWFPGKVEYIPKDYDGPEDKRFKTADDVNEAKAEIDEWYNSQTT